MAFKHLRLFKIKDGHKVSEGPDAYDKAIRLSAGNGGTEINNIEITITRKINEKELKADDTSKFVRRLVGIEGTVKAYNVDEKASKEIFGFDQDVGGGLLVTADTENPEFGVFFRSEDNDGVKKCIWLYDVSFKETDETYTTSSGDDATNLELSYSGPVVTYEGRSFVEYICKEGERGYVEEGAEDDPDFSIVFPVQQIDSGVTGE